MNLLISGYGKMGRLIEARACDKGFSIAGVIDPALDGAPSASGACSFRSLGEFSGKADVAVDFTCPAVALDNISAFLARGIPLVVGTTGWYDALPVVRDKVLAVNGALLYASNFSLGVNLFYKVAAYAAGLFDKFDDYDVAGFEVHHNKKADSPSGTAKTLASVVLENMSRKKRSVYDKLDRPPAGDEIHFASLRVGNVPGTHGLMFDSNADTIELKHTARSREGLVAGALVAAEWLAGKAAEGCRGVYTLDDVLA
jgi:4-hydroxy-tetrahydrodipicolinate reductase